MTTSNSLITKNRRLYFIIILECFREKKKNWKYNFTELYSNSWKRTHYKTWRVFIFLVYLCCVLSIVFQYLCWCLISRIFLDISSLISLHGAPSIHSLSVRRKIRVLLYLHRTHGPSKSRTMYFMNILKEQVQNVQIRQYIKNIMKKWKIKIQNEKIIRIFLISSIQKKKCTSEQFLQDFFYKLWKLVFFNIVLIFKIFLKASLAP